MAELSRPGDEFQKKKQSSNPSFPVFLCSQNAEVPPHTTYRPVDMKNDWLSDEKRTHSNTYPHPSDFCSIMANMGVGIHLRVQNAFRDWWKPGES